MTHFGRANPRRSSIGTRLLLAALLSLGSFARGASPPSNLSNLTERVRALVSHVSVGLAPGAREFGPKGIVSVDFDGDGHLDLAVSDTDGSITVLFGAGDGKFGSPRHLLTPGNGSLRGLVTADFDRDQRPDLAVASPFEGRVYVFRSAANQNFAAPQIIQTWRGARNVEAGDFDGDGWMDLAVAGPNNGLRQYRGLPGAEFETVTNLVELSYSFLDLDKFPKPLYSMKRFRPPGATRDWLVATHAEATNVWVLAPTPGGSLEIRSTVKTSANVHGLDVAPIAASAAAGLPDLVTVLRDTGAVDVYRGTMNASGGFGFLPTRDSYLHKDVPGGPRAVSVVDLNSDGWNDLVVVVRNLDSVRTYTNSHSSAVTLVDAGERPVGTSPRELVTGDFNQDGNPDVAVMNRGSSDVTVLLAYQQSAAYRAVDNIYLVDGNVSGLAVLKFNNDPYDDVIQLHRASGDFSVWLAHPDGSGRLLPPVYYTVGNVPATQVFMDVNGDGVPDVITANLGTTRIERGSISVWLGHTNFDGTLGSESRIEMPAGVEGRLFALVPGRFDGGPMSFVAGFLDGTLVFFRGDGRGGFVATHVRRIPADASGVSQPRSLTAVDLDGDGDLDLAGLDLSGAMWVMENPGRPANGETSILKPGAVVVQRFAPPGPDGVGGRKIVAVKYDTNSVREDLVIGSGKGAWLYRNLGEPGSIQFAPPQRLAGSSSFVSDFLFADLDNDKDGNPDLVVSCRDLDCFTVIRGSSGVSSLPIDAPASRFIASGDLDGDGKLDLIGSGRVLWTSLSSRPAGDTPPLVSVGERSRLAKVLINEVLASNSALPLASDGDRKSEWIELFNGGSNNVQLKNWSIRVAQAGDNGLPTTNQFAIYNAASIAPGQPLLFICSDRTNASFYHTGFRLSAAGGTITLLDPSGARVDEITYPPQRPNISYARYRDALRSFVFNPFPSPGRPNLVNGMAEPTLRFRGVPPSSFEPGQPVRFLVDVADDIGAASVVMHYRALGGNTPRAVMPLFDDGNHGDGGAGDGLFAGELPEVPPPDVATEIQFYFELTDLDDAVIVAPEDPEFGTPDALGNAYQLAFNAPRPSLEISEILARNRSGLSDGTNAEGTLRHPDWLEVRNTGRVPIALEGVAICQQVGDNPRYRFPESRWIGPGEHFIVLCDNDPERGTNHAPIGLNRAGDTIMLAMLSPNRSWQLVDSVTFGEQKEDISWARLGAGGQFWRVPPTPGTQNVSQRIEAGIDSGWMGWTGSAANGALGILALPTHPDVTCVVERSDALETGRWLLVDEFAGDGIERAYSWSLAETVYFRWHSGMP